MPRKVLADRRLRTVLVELCDARGDTEEVRALMVSNGFELESEYVLSEGVSGWIFGRPVPGAASKDTPGQ